MLVTNNKVKIISVRFIYTSKTYSAPDHRSQLWSWLWSRSRNRRRRSSHPPTFWRDRRQQTGKRRGNPQRLARRGTAALWGLLRRLLRSILMKTTVFRPPLTGTAYAADFCNYSLINSYGNRPENASYWFKTTDGCLPDILFLICEKSFADTKFTTW